MNSGTHIAVDLGAESGRVFLGAIRGGVLCIHEIHRFPNGPLVCGRNLHWDAARLWDEIRKALASIEEPDIAGIGVDAWGVDYALLGHNGELLQNPFCYRDPRNARAMEEVLRLVSRDRIYGETGVQFLPINTLIQLFAAKRETPQQLGSAARLLMIPDLFHYWLSGNARSEYTAASTTQFTNPVTRGWAKSLLAELGLPADLPAEMVEPGWIAGGLSPNLLKSGGNRARVIAPASHDTASAVAAVEANGSTAFVSSGTWSLVGIELDSPVISPEAMRLNFTNEGGVAGTTRLLKNVMGLWMLQACRNRWMADGRRFEYGELAEAARTAPAFERLVDPDHASFLNPPDMPAAIDRFCRVTGQRAPDSPAAYTRAVLESLALKYRVVIGDIETLIGRRIDRIRVMGGGSRNALLNQFTADATGKQVIAGPQEAAVLGNLGVQMISLGELGSLGELRALIEHSFPTEIYEPGDTARWDAQDGRFRQYCAEAGG